MSLDNVILESEVYNIIGRIDRLEKDIKDKVPGELLYTIDGSINGQTRWGAVLSHLILARASIRTFV